MPVCGWCHENVQDVSPVKVAKTRVANVCPPCEGDVFGDSEYKKATVGE